MGSYREVPLVLAVVVMRRGGGEEVQHSASLLKSEDRLPSCPRSAIVETDPQVSKRAKWRKKEKMRVHLRGAQRQNAVRRHC